MSDLISRQAAIDIVEFECGEWSGLAKTIAEEIEQLPSAQPKSGEWEITNLGAVGVFDSCSECKRVVKHKSPFYNFCPNCGADMREVTT